MLQEISIQGCKRAKHKSYGSLDDLCALVPGTDVLVYAYWKSRRYVRKTDNRGASGYGRVPAHDRWVRLTMSKAFHYFGARRDETRCAFDSP